MTSTSTTSVTAAAAAITSVTLEVPDPDTAGAFYRAAFGLGSQVRVRASQAPTTGFRGFTLSLVVSQPSTVDALAGGALDAGATTIKPVTKSLWGYGGVGEEGHRSGYPAGRRHRAPAGMRGRRRDQAVLRRAGPDGGTGLRQQVRRVRRPGVAHQAGALQAPGPGQGRRGPAGGHRVAPD